MWLPSKRVQQAEPGGDVCRGITAVTATLRGPTQVWAGKWPYIAERYTLACPTDSPNTQLVGRNAWRAGESCTSSPVAEIRLQSLESLTPASRSFSAWQLLPPSHFYLFNKAFPGFPSQLYFCVTFKSSVLSQAALSGCLGFKSRKLFHLASCLQIPV